MDGSGEGGEGGGGGGGGSPSASPSASAQRRALLQSVARTARLEKLLADHGVSIGHLLRTWESADDDASTLADRVERSEGRERILANMLRSAEDRAQQPVEPEPEPEPRSPAAAASIPAMALAASAALKRGDWPEALQQYSNALGCVSEGSRAAALHNSRGAVLFELGRFREALRDSDESVRADPSAFLEDRQPQLRAALCCLRLGEMQESRRRFGQLEDPDLPFIRHLTAAEAAAADAEQAVAAAEASRCRQAAERMRVVCEEHCPGWAEGWALRVAALAAASEWVAATEAAEQGLSKLGEQPKLLVLLGRCLLRTGHGATAAEKWERAVRLDPDDQAAVGLLKAYRRGVGSNGSVGAMQEVAAEERRQAGNAQQPRHEAQPESTNTEQDKENLEEEKQTLGEKQDDRVRALRSAQCEEASRASERERAAPAIIARLRARVDRKPFRQVLAEFGVPVAAGAGEEEGVAAAYRKALVKFHPDRALQRGLSAEGQLEAEETYKLLQNLHEAWERRQNQQVPVSYSGPTPTGPRRQSSAKSAPRRTASGGRGGNAAGGGRWSAGAAKARSSGGFNGQAGGARAASGWSRQSSAPQRAAPRAGVSGTEFSSRGQAGSTFVFTTGGRAASSMFGGRPKPERRGSDAGEADGKGGGAGFQPNQPWTWQVPT